MPADDDSNPYRRIAADLRGAIACGALAPGETLPPFAILADLYEVSFGTAQRAVALLREEGLISVCRGRRAVVLGGSESVAEVVDLR